MTQSNDDELDKILEVCNWILYARSVLYLNLIKYLVKHKMKMSTNESELD